MKIGYSCWGFLGKGITDTPDGGRSHRLTLINALIKQGADIVILQKNRDYLECGEDFSKKHLSFHSRFPDIDALFIEYRWRIPGRNYKVNKKGLLYTPDLDRQNELINFYQYCNIPILIWDKDQKLSFKDQMKIKNSIVFEPALKPRFGRKKLFFPMNDNRARLAKKKIESYNKSKRKFDLVYIGNQYERDSSFKEFIDKPARLLKTETQIFGNWNKYPERYKENLKKFPNVVFKDRLPFTEVNGIYKKSFSTVLIVPNRYYSSGHFTQRLFESLWDLCIPLTPDKYYDVKKIIVEDFIISFGNDVVDRINKFRKKSNSEIRKIIEKQLDKLDIIFNPEVQAKIIINQIEKFPKLIKKSYKNSERYFCELKHLEIFRKKNIPVPKIYQYDDKRKIITIEKIDGKISDILNKKEIELCIDALCRIVFVLGLERNNKREISKYISKVKSNILLWCEENNYPLNIEKLNNLLRELEKCCYISIFKDAKPFNWVFQKNKVYAIDFDYVKKSFFLADLAQLLSYVSLKRKINMWEYVKYFLQRVLPSQKYDGFYVPFMLAVVNSNIASSVHNSNLSKKTIAGFNNQNIKILKELRLIQ